jgi:hypothetical protein
MAQNCLTTGGDGAGPNLPERAERREAASERFSRVSPVAAVVQRDKAVQAGGRKQLVLFVSSVGDPSARLSARSDPLERPDPESLSHAPARPAVVFRLSSRLRRRRAETSLSHRLGVTWRPADGLQLSGSVGQAFRVPNGFGPGAEAPDSFVPNPDLTPRRRCRSRSARATTAATWSARTAG